MAISRKRKLDHFYSLTKIDMSILDVGVSAEKEGAMPARNYFLKNYRYDPSTYVGLGVQDLTGMEKLFPGKCLIRYPGIQFPFVNKKFDWVFCNAVIEHVGTFDEQVFFLNEMLRVAKEGVFFTTPNKFSPIEAHTNVLFRH